MDFALIVSPFPSAFLMRGWVYAAAAAISPFRSLGWSHAAQVLRHNNTQASAIWPLACSTTCSSQKSPLFLRLITWSRVPEGLATGGASTVGAGGLVTSASSDRCGFEWKPNEAEAVFLATASRGFFRAPLFPGSAVSEGGTAAVLLAMTRGSASQRLREAGGRPCCPSRGTILAPSGTSSDMRGRGAAAHQSSCRCSSCSANRPAIALKGSNPNLITSLIFPLVLCHKCN